MFRQKAALVYQTKLDTSSDLKITVDGTLKHIITDSYYMADDTLNGAMVNNNIRQLTNTADQEAFNGSVFLYKKIFQTRPHSLIPVNGCLQSKQGIRIFEIENKFL
ncbi:MAG: hypothetical protein WDM78_02190 [Puia sp.]